MHQLKRICQPFLVWIIIVFALSGCNESSKQVNAVEPKQKTYYIFDTVVNIRIYDERADDSHFEEIGALLEDIDAKMSRTNTTSEIAKVNDRSGQDAVKVSEETWFVMNRALEFAEWSGGKFDPTVGPLVNLWQIGSEGQRVPSQTEINEALELIDYRLVEMREDQRAIRLPKRGMALDLGAIAKGYAADKIAEYLDGLGFDSAIIDLGGNIIAHGSKTGNLPWTIGIQDPADARGKPIGTIKVKDKTIVSSGVYERYFMENDVRYHHILNTENGYPVQNELVSVTIITDRSIDADALSTSVFAMGLEDGLALINDLDHVEAIFITEDDQVYITPGLKDELEVTVDKYKVSEL